MTDGFSHTDSMLTSSEVGMAIQLSIDRFEGEQSNIAMLLIDAGQQIDFPRDLLPADAQPGDVLSVTIERDLAATLPRRKHSAKKQRHFRMI